MKDSTDRTLEYKRALVSGFLLGVVPCTPRARLHWWGWSRVWRATSARAASPYRGEPDD
jgi:hypothetical protein